MAEKEEHRGEHGVAFVEHHSRELGTGAMASPRESRQRRCSPRMVHSRYDVRRSVGGGVGCLKCGCDPLVRSCARAAPCAYALTLRKSECRNK